MSGILARSADWMVVAHPLGIDKALHVVVGAALVLIGARRLGRRRAAVVVLVAGVVLELVQGTLGSLGFDLASPLGGTAELADVVADVVGIALGLAVAHRFDVGLADPAPPSTS